MPVRRYEPVVIMPRSKYEARHDFGIEDSLNRADYLSSVVLEDTYDAANRSRGKDNALLRDVKAAIAEAPWYLRARAGSVPPSQPVRSARAASVPPRRPQSAYYLPEPQPLPTSRLRASRPPPPQYEPWWRARARSQEPVRRADYLQELEAHAPLPTSQLWAHRPKPLRKDASRLARARAEQTERRRFYPEAYRRAASLPRSYERASDYYPPIPDVKEVALSRYLYAHRGRFGKDSKPPRPSLGNFPQVYVPWKGQGPSNRSKAAIIGSRLEGADGGRKQRRPRSEFAANKLREMKRDEIERKYNY